MEKSRNLEEQLLEYGARTIKLVESLPNTLVGWRENDRMQDGWRV